MTDDDQSVAMRALETDPDMQKAVKASALLPKLKAKLRRVSIDGTEYFVAEGDTLLDEAQLGAYAQHREAVDAERRASERAAKAGMGVRRLDGDRFGLIGIVENGQPVCWAPGTVLSYRVVRDSFPQAMPDPYAAFVAAMAAAAGAWQQTCGVQFRHDAHLDDAPGAEPAGAVFAVRYQADSPGGLLASAFFPNDPKSRRRMMIYPGYFAPGLDFDRTGILRHEIGHILGFRHEHISSQAPPACPGEDDIWERKVLSPYDPKSVMHYFCGGVGSKTLEITELDRAGAQLLYGPPLAPAAAGVGA